jgi:hypothetical protein
VEVVRSLRRRRPPVEVEPGERLLAWAALAGGEWVAGTRDALYLPAGRLPWEQVEAADWDQDLGRLRVSEVGRWGESRVEHGLVLDESAATEADRLLQLVRERVTASVLLVRHVPITGRRGVRVVARRAPSGRSPVLWIYEYDAGIDPDDPFVQAAAADALETARAHVGLD